MGALGFSATSIHQMQAFVRIMAELIVTTASPTRRTVACELVDSINADRLAATGHILFLAFKNLDAIGFPTLISRPRWGAGVSGLAYARAVHHVHRPVAHGRGVAANWVGPFPPTVLAHASARAHKQIPLCAREMCLGALLTRPKCAAAENFVFRRLTIGDDQCWARHDFAGVCPPVALPCWVTFIALCTFACAWARDLPHGLAAGRRLVADSVHTSALITCGIEYKTALSDEAEVDTWSACTSLCGFVERMSLKVMNVFRSE